MKKKNETIQCTFRKKARFWFHIYKDIYFSFSSATFIIFIDKENKV